MLKAAAFLALFICAEANLYAQSSIHPSLVGDNAAEARKPIMEASNYNILMGPVSVDLSAGINFEFNDNIVLTQQHRTSDLLIQPQITANVLWQVSQVNSLRLSLGVGYQKYLANSQYDTDNLTIAPNSKLAFDIYFGDFRITLYDQFAISQSPLSSINVAGVANFVRFENTAGISGLWDGNQLTILGGIGHYTFYALDSSFSFANHAEEQLYLSAGLKINDSVSAGLRGTFAYVHYDEKINNDAANLSIGVFAEAQLTRYLTVLVEGGYQGSSSDGNGTNGDASQLNSYYARLQFQHRLNAYWTDSLDLGHETQVGLTTNTTETTYVRYAASWRMNSQINVAINAFYELGQDSGTDGEKTNMYGGSAVLSYDLSRKIHLTGGYRFTNRNSNLADRSYYQNAVLLGITYDF